MKLKEWMEQNAVTVTYIASRVGVTKSAVTRWASGDTPPSLLNALTIEKLTAGNVTPHDWGIKVGETEEPQQSINDL